MRATLVKRGWLRRTLEVEMSDGMHLVDYDGTGLGYEQVNVDGFIVRILSFWWYVPRFDFKLGGWPSVVEVGVHPWLTLRSFALRVNEQVLYSEGVSDTGSKPLDGFGDWRDLA
jgi:hypothetical protein